MVAFVTARIGRRIVTRTVRRLANGSVQRLNALDRRRPRRGGSGPATAITATTTTTTSAEDAAEVRGEATSAGDRSEALREHERIQPRLETLTAVVGSLVTAVVWIIAGTIVLGLFDVSLAPLLASAGVVGVALGFGAQSVVSDFLAGFFMLFEDQYGVGDVVDVGFATRQDDVLPREQRPDEVTQRSLRPVASSSTEVVGGRSCRFLAGTQACV